jgi:hypothetical protein
MWECIKTNFVRHALNRPQIGGKKGENPLVIGIFQYNGPHGEAEAFRK